MNLKIEAETDRDVKKKKAIKRKKRLAKWGCEASQRARLT